MSEQKFLFDRDQRGQPLELLIAQDLYNHNIPFRFNQFSGTHDPRRQDFDIYIGSPENAIFWDAKMDWSSGISGNIFVEEKSLLNTKADKFIYGRLILDVFDVNRLREMYEAKSNGLYTYRHVVGGDQAGNRGMLLGWKDIKANSTPYWQERLAIQQVMKAAA